MRILGIDPGLICTGYGVVDIDHGKIRVQEAGVIRPNPKDPFEHRIAKTYQHIGSILAAHRPDTVVLEKLYAHHQHPATACILGHVRGVICLAVYDHKTPLCEHSVKRIRKALMGNGNATKQQVRVMVRQIANLKETAMALDTSDALALALGHAHMLRFRIL